MPKALVIAEKPSVAADFARALGKISRTKEGYYENDNFVITSAVGHLVELCLPNEMDKRHSKWSFDNLPILPQRFELKPAEKNKAQLDLIAKLLQRKDIDRVINACDAGREGELIFHYIMQFLGNTKPVQRLWLNSMTPEAIREGFSQLRPASELRNLAQAAICRSESDWLVGINATRALTAFNSQKGAFYLTPVGRVQTPTLSILVERELRIRNFQPRDYFEVYADFSLPEGTTYRGRWFNPNFKKSQDEDQKPERIWERQAAEAIVQKCLGKPATVTEERKPSTQSCPPLFDLTSLQREANSRFNFTARRTLQILQALYEKHKVLTYPRTDSRHLPTDYLSTVRNILSDIHIPELAPFAKQALDAGWVHLTPRVFDNAKVTDHHAIIPTTTPPKSLDEAEAKIYDLVTRRLVAIFFPPARFETTTRISTVEAESFRSEGKILIEPGWLAVYGKSAAPTTPSPDSESSDKLLPPLPPNSTPIASNLEIKPCQTKPPARFTEATLLAAMEGAGKLVEDDELRQALSARGLGTPATRAQIIEGLVSDGYVQRNGRELVATQKGISLIALLRSMGIQALTSPEMTGEWEFRLKNMEQGKFERAQFMQEICKFTSEVVEKAKTFSGEVATEHLRDLTATCPRCKNSLFKESLKAYTCSNCNLTIWKVMASREFSPDEVKTLLEQGKVGPLEGFRSKLGRPFSATVILNPEFKQQFDFAADAPPAPNQEEIQALPSLGPCPACKKGSIRESTTAYLCDQSSSPSNPCNFRIAKTILKLPIPPEQIQKLLTHGKTDLLSGFISKKGRPFKAYLVLQNDKVIFEFEEKKAAENGNAASSPTKTKSPPKKTSKKT